MVVFCVYFLVEDEYNLILEYGYNVGIVPRLCFEFGLRWTGVEPDKAMAHVAQREFYADMMECISKQDMNFVEWYIGMYPTHAQHFLLKK